MLHGGARRPRGLSLQRNLASGTGIRLRARGRTTLPRERARRRRATLAGRDEAKPTARATHLASRVALVTPRPHEDETSERPSREVHGPRRGLRQRFIVTLGTHAQDQVISHYPAAHVPVEGEANATEHVDLCDALVPSQSRPNPLGQLQVIGHRCSLGGVSMQDRPARLGEVTFQRRGVCSEPIGDYRAGTRVSALTAAAACSAARLPKTIAAIWPFPGR